MIIKEVKRRQRRERKQQVRHLTCRSVPDVSRINTNEETLRYISYVDLSLIDRMHTYKY